jgi:hypothetical protein
LIFESSYGTSPVVTRLRAGTRTDSDGDPVESWDSPDRLRLPRAFVGDPDSEETEAPGENRITAERVLYAPGSATSPRATVSRSSPAPSSRSGASSGSPPSTAASHPRP